MGGRKAYTCVPWEFEEIHYIIYLGRQGYNRDNRWGPDSEIQVCFTSFSLWRPAEARMVFSCRIAWELEGWKHTRLSHFLFLQGSHWGSGGQSQDSGVGVPCAISTVSIPPPAEWDPLGQRETESVCSEYIELSCRTRIKKEYQSKQRSLVILDGEIGRWVGS